MPSDDIVISVRNLTKSYRLFNHPGDRIKQFFSLGLKQYHREFTAIKDISFDIRKGETVGIIGRNGSGKSTLLQLICGILKPTSGTVQVNGRVSALLELGAGFNPEFTGRENVYFQGALMGFSKAQMDGRFDEIATFADIGEFIEQPVRTYSSGMFVRLAFAVAVHVEPEILIIDEALGVGDSEFQERSILRIKAMQEKGTTTLFVSHSIQAVRNFCRHVFWLDDGICMLEGRAEEVCRTYQAEIDRRNVGNSGLENLLHSQMCLHPSGREKSISIKLATIDSGKIDVGEGITLHFQLQFSSSFDPVTEFGLGVIIRDDEGQIVTVLNTVRDDITLMGRVTEICLLLPRTSFVPGRYWISANVCDRDILFAYDEQERCLSFEVAVASNRYGIPRWEGVIACEHAWIGQKAP